MLAILKTSVYSIILTSPLKYAIAGFNCRFKVWFFWQFDSCMRDRCMDKRAGRRAGQAYPLPMFGCLSVADFETLTFSLFKTLTFPLFVCNHNFCNPPAFHRIFVDIRSNTLCRPSCTGNLFQLVRLVFLVRNHKKPHNEWNINYKNAMQKKQSNELSINHKNQSRNHFLGRCILAFL